MGASYQFTKVRVTADSYGNSSKFTEAGGRFCWCESKSSGCFLQSLALTAFFHFQLFEYHLEDMKFVCSTTQNFVENQDLHAVQNIVLNPQNENVFICQNDEFVFTVKKSPVIKCNAVWSWACFYLEFFFFQQNSPSDSEDTPRKSSKKARNHVDQEKVEYKFSKASSCGFKHLINISLIKERELLAVGVNPITLIEQLPMSLKEKKFGIS